ncbi:response regulator [Sphingomonas sp.]|jgi:DNA-binding response OmpR family regulator|uniref:response regulator transcription factor n=1 Tax=Sphingomonas sp. TaxID=28214 RepID=UPI002E0FA941|nr:response regulator [Sphingomonas sp.]
MATILVADDDKILVGLVRARLSGAGHEVLVAHDGESALEIANTALPAAVILDAMMPIVGGAEVLRRLREEPRFARLPIMMLTARTSEEDVVAFLKAGATEYLAKPFMPQELLLRLEMMLRNARRD